ncbi:unnamed protein product [Rhizophagus irregularis]|uniref:Uncharacterized protein n=1 Tax=Rhizophagus irregularis TaxID=588596 RepID=A0A915YY45_9GLOM|nr:unnamed protein product [Rhizophagus irregularis]
MVSSKYLLKTFPFFDDIKNSLHVSHVTIVTIVMSKVNLPLFLKKNVKLTSFTYKQTILTEMLLQDYSS